MHYLKTSFKQKWFVFVYNFASFADLEALASAKLISCFLLKAYSLLIKPSKKA